MSTDSSLARISRVMGERVNVTLSRLKSPRPGALGGSTHTETRTTPGRLAWPLHGDDTKIPEAFHVLYVSQFDSKVYFKKQYRPFVNEMCVQHSVIKKKTFAL